MRSKTSRDFVQELQTVGDHKFDFSAEIVEKHVEEHVHDIKWAENVTGFDVVGQFLEVPNPVESETSSQLRSE